MNPYLKSSPEPEVVLRELPPPKRQRFLLQHMMLLIVFCAVGCAVLVFFGAMLFVVSLVTLVGLVIGSIVITVVGFRTQQDAVVRSIAIAADRGMPLAPALFAVSDQCGFFLKGRVLGLAESLHAGIPLPDALDMAPGALPRDAEIMVRVGHATGVLSGALREAVDARKALPYTWGWVVFRACYLLLVLLILQGITGFIMYFITPKFEAIFKDFGVALPQFTILVINATHLAMRYGFIGAILFALEFFLLMLLPLTLIGWININFPLLDRFFTRRSAALILRTLARVVEAGQPLNRAFATLARRYPGRWVREKLTMVALDIDRGHEWQVALYENRLITQAEASVLDAARRVGNLPWALRDTAETAERRLAYRTRAWLELLFPIFVLTVGALVFAVAVAYFAPLVTLIERLAG